MLKIIGRSLLFVLLTVTTQVGGIVLLIAWLVSNRLQARWQVRWPRAIGTAVFVTLYLVTTAFIVPPLARLNGRVPLPLFGDTLAPRSTLTVLFNRNYVDRELEQMVRGVAHDFVHDGHPPLVYLDACFPFFDGFPLLPHLSHNDGRKLDLAFCYRNAVGESTEHTPSIIGYGALEQTRDGEEDTAARCASQGAWWYDMLGCVPVDRSIVLDEERTLDLVNALAAHPLTSKIFIEPFLKARWGIVSGKVRFHGCHAVSHADHIHVQLRLSSCSRRVPYPT